MRDLALDLLADEGDPAVGGYGLRDREVTPEPLGDPGGCLRPRLGIGGGPVTANLLTLLWILLKAWVVCVDAKTSFLVDVGMTHRDDYRIHRYVHHNDIKDLQPNV